MLSFCRKLPLCVLLLLVVIGAEMSGQSTEADIRARLKGKPLYLRGLWRDDTLRFDGKGELAGISAPISFTLSGFNFDSAKVRPDRLLLTGYRVGTTFSNNTAKRIQLGAVRIEIGMPADGNLKPALDAIFADGLGEIAPLLPWYWQGYATCQLLHTTDSSKCSMFTGIVAPPSSAAQPDKWDSPPRITHQVDAKWNSYAEQLGYGGTTITSLVVKSDGSPSQFAVISPLGLGMDEQALAAVAQYKFAPATKNKSPITSEIEIQVKFEIHSSIWLQ